MIEFTVIGRPVPAGSKTKNARGNIYDSTGKRGKDWRRLVQAAAQSHMSQFALQPIDGPVFVEMCFNRKRPKGGTKLAYPTMAPDVLKLARAVEDALTGICYTDDALIVDERIRKLWGDEWGVLVNIEPYAGLEERW